MIHGLVLIHLKSSWYLLLRVKQKQEVRQLKSIDIIQRSDIQFHVQRFTLNVIMCKLHMQINSVYVLLLIISL